MRETDAVVIGGGFYGCCTALSLAETMNSVTLLEKGSQLLGRASFINQARVHNGYHYPRSFMTAVRSAANSPRFLDDFAECVDTSFEMVYAIARSHSRVTGYQFQTFCKRIGAPVRSAPPRIRRLFRSDLIEDVFCVNEYAFHAGRLRDLLFRKLEQSGVLQRLGAEVLRVSTDEGSNVRLSLSSGEEIDARLALNCTYSLVNRLLAASGVPCVPLKHEITEVALIEAPEELQNLGITVMDGPFFSTMPFPALNLHSLTHVRYTPHESWSEPQDERNPHTYLAEREPQSKFIFMLKDAQRYLPCLAGAKYVRSLFEIKTVLPQNETDDGRPILFKWHDEFDGKLASIVGAKIDNIYDALDTLSRMSPLASSRTSLI